MLDLSYGENPHQRAALYSEAGVRSHVLSRVAKLHGRALSFNNVLDLDSARRLVDDFEQPACTIVKHNNPCGVAIGKDALEAYEKALACDPMSAFGGVIAFNRPVSEELAKRLHECGKYTLDLESARNEQVVGSNPTSGSRKVRSAALSGSVATDTR